MNPVIARLTLAMLAGAAMVASSPASASSYSTIYSFGGGNDGANPLAGLLNVSGTLYGTTVFGGTGNCTSLYGSSCGTIFSVDSTGAESVVHSFIGSDGFQPSAALINVNGTLYGTAGFGGGGCGGSGCGTVFKLASGSVTVLHSFTTGGDGTYPFASLVSMGGKLYGTTQYGGASNNGTIFSIDISSGVETVEYSFQGGNDGAQSIAGLTKIQGVLYGTTLQGGSGGNGTVFSFDPATSTHTVLHAFSGTTDGAHPYAGVINVGGTLYGATRFGGTGCSGSGGCGALFTVDPSSGAESVVYSFSGSDGANPLASLVNVGGTLYGTTVAGGFSVSSSTYGTIYSFDPSTGTETVLHSFGSGSDGREPRTTLINVGGTLYGTTAAGGTATYGTVFAYTP
jgi:uncharacterized repeat protein (TIGR03803 family)